MKKQIIYNYRNRINSILFPDKILYTFFSLNEQVN